MGDGLTALCSCGAPDGGTGWRHAGPRLEQAVSPARPGAALRGHMLPLESAAAETGPWGDRSLVEGAPCASRGSHPLLAGSLRLARGRPAAPGRRPLERRRGRPQECECASKGPTGAGRPAQSPAHQGVVTAACRACSRCISGAVAVRPQVARTTVARTTALSAASGSGARRALRCFQASLG